MATTILEVGGMLSILDPQGVEKQLKRMPGVYVVTVNITAGTASIKYDETVTNAEALRAKIIECGFHCRGEVLPNHVCATGGEAALPKMGHGAHAQHTRHAGPGRADARSRGARRDRAAQTIWAPARTRPRRRTPRQSCRTTWRTRWATAPAWTCRPWSATCATAS